MTTNEDTDHTFAAYEFGYADADGDALASVKITELPAAGTGTLTLDGTAITLTDLPKTVTAPDLTGSKLKYSPPANENGMSYASFTFKVNDGTEDSASEYFMTINVTAVNDPATGAPTISGTAHVGLTLTASTAGIDDVDGLPSAFTYQWKRVDADGTSNPTDIGADSSAYTLTAAEEGKKVLVEVSFTDNGGSSEGPLASAAYPSSGTVVNLTVSFGETTYMVAEGWTQSVTVTLSADPERTVVIPITHTPQSGADYPADYSVIPESLTFNTGQMSQTITFTATQDEVDDDGESVLLGFGAPLPGGVSLGTTVTATVSITDDDGARVSVSESSLTIAEGSSGTYTIVLDSQPTASVAVAINDPSNTDVTAEPASLTFSSTDWSTPKTVTVNAAQDADAEDETATVTHTVTSTDSSYSGASANSVAVMVTDDDEVPVTVSFGAGAYTVLEGGTQSVTVTLSADPERTVVIPLTAADQDGAAPADYTVPTSVTFDAGEMSKTIAFTATQDDVDDDDESVKLAIGTTLPSRVTQGATNETTVSITDDDDPQVAVSFDRASYRVLEGDTTTVGVTLSGDPERTVVIPLVATEEGGASSEDYSGVPSSVTINEGETSKTFEFMAMADDASDAGEGVMIGFGTSLPSRVAEGTPNEARVSINQMSTQLGSGVAVSFEMGVYTVSEGGTQAVTVMLSAAPSQTTVIPITTTNQGGATSADYSGVPASVTFNAGETLMSFNFMATQDDVDENCECVLLTFGALPSGVSAGPTDEAKVSIADIATTPEGTPTVPPAPTSLTTYGEDQSLNVMWEIPAGEDARAPVTSYRMRYRQVGASSWRNVSRANDGLTLWEDITGLTNRRAYEVQVAAVSRMGTGAWASVKGTPQAPYAPPPGPEDDEAFDMGRLRIYWLAPDADQTNVLHRESCTGSEGFRVFWTGPDDDTRADKWAVHINTRRGAGEVSYNFADSSGTSMNGTVNFEGDSALSLSVRGRFGSTWGTWSPPVSLYCHEPGAPADTCSLQVQQQAVENTPAEGGPRIDGIPELGQTLSADTTAIEDADGLENVVFQYQWLAEGAAIAGAAGTAYTVGDYDVGKAITVRVTFTDDAGNEETLTSAPAVVTTAAGLQLQSATVDGATLTLTYSEVLDTDVTLPKSAFALNVNGSSRSLIGTGVGQSDVLLLLSSAVESGDTVTVDYTVPEGQDLIQDTHGRKAPSFSGQAVTNDTAPATDDTAKAPEDTASTAQLTATIHDQPSSHNGEDAFTFELRFSEDPQPDFSYTTVRDHAFTVTGGSVTYVRRLEPGKNVRWEVTVTPGSSAAVAIALNATTDCAAQGAICTEEGGKLSGGLQLAVPGPNTPATETPNAPATGLPSISGTAQVGDTLTAVTSGIEDADGLDNVTFNHQWLADDADIAGATGGSYILADADEGKTIKVQVSFTDDGGNDEILTSVATAAVAPKPNSPATGAPTISGTAQAGETLTSSTTGIADGDGLTSATFTYQWLADDADIAGATGSSYTLVGADEGKAIKVRASFTDDGGNQESLTSEPTAAVAEAAPTEPPPAPQNLTAVVNGDGHIVLSWAAPDGGRVTGYRILRRRPALGEDVLLEYVANTRSTAATFTDTNVTPGVQHVYRVQAISAAGQSQRSNYVNVTP